MGLFDDLSSQRRGGTCTVEHIRSVLTGDNLADFDRVIADRSIACSDIARALRAVESLREVQAQTLNRHRRGDCRCPS